MDEVPRYVNVKQYVSLKSAQNPNVMKEDVEEGNCRRREGRRSEEGKERTVVVWVK
jgi:hypothetical protein